jgi:transcriptional regulator MraZ
MEWEWAPAGFAPETQDMFRGANRVTLDAKGRVAVPARYRERLAATCDGQLVVTVDRDHCLLVYPLPDWDDIERRLMAAANLSPEVRRLQRLLVGHATEVELDSHGRILISQALREFAALDGTAMFVGQGRKLELWDEGRWIERRDAWLQADDEGALDLPAELESLSL